VQPGSTSTEILISAAYTAETMASPTARAEAWYALDTSTAGSFLMHTIPDMRRQLPVLIQAAATTSFSIPLRQGWNMVTLPAVLDLDSVSQFADVFGPGFIAGFWYDPLLMAWIQMDNVSDLPPPGTGMMVYINGTPAAPLLEGQRITCTAEFPVRAGWNLVGAWADTRVILPDKHNLVAGDIATLNAAGTGNDIIANGDIIPKGTAFWIYSKAAGTVIFA
jgi:hypothetical protein